ncbi:MAG TPA: GAF domain-containing protein [Anaerolineales bacterium]|nr:GAF domain-containing protein [Anaerolineales bacterium]
MFDAQGGEIEAGHPLDMVDAQLSRLYNLSNHLIEARTSQQAARLAASFVLQATGAHSAILYLFDPGGKLVWHFGLDRYGKEMSDEPLTRLQASARQIMHSGEPLIISGEEPNAQELIHPYLRRYGIKALASLPLYSGEKSIGVLYIRDIRPHPFSRIELQEVALYASLAAVTIEGLRLLEDSRRRENDLRMMVETAHMMISTLDLEELLYHIAVRLARVAGMDDCAISSYESRTNLVRVMAQYSQFGIREDADLGKAYKLEDFPATAHVLDSGQPCVIHVLDPQADSAEVDLLKKLGYRTLLMFPLISAERPVGLVELYSAHPHFEISAIDLKRLNDLGELASLALSNARLYAKEQRARLTAETLQQATLALSSTLELNQVLDMILEQLKQVVHFDSASLMLLENDCLSVLAVHNHPHPEAALEVKINVAQDQLAQSVIFQKESVILPDAQGDARFHSLGEANYVRGWLGVPLNVRNETIGILTLDSLMPEAYTNEDARLAMAFANQAALAIANARLYQSEREQRTLAEALHEISLALSSSLDTAAIMETLLEQIRRVVPYDSANVMLLENNQIRIAAHQGYDRFGVTDLVSDFTLPVDQIPNLAHMAYTRQPHFVPDVKTDHNWIEVETARHIGSWLGAPLVTQNHLLGFLSLDKVQRGYYTAKHAAHLESLAGHAALALSNALNFGKVERAAITDFITATFNHRYFQQALRQEIERAQRFERSVSVLMIDLDDFKMVNDTYGHPCGDRLLQALAARLRSSMRSVDVLARYGGEEFAVILPETPAGSLASLGERLRKAVAVRPFLIDDTVIPLTVSIGGATFPDHAREAYRLVECADHAMYQAKKDGRNCVRLAE